MNFTPKPLYLCTMILLCTVGIWIGFHQLSTTAHSTVQQSPDENNSPSANLATLTQNNKSDESVPKLNTPYEIRSFIQEQRQQIQTNLKPLWQQLGIESTYAGEPPYSRPEAFMSECVGCDAEIFHYDLDDEPGKEIL